MNRKIYISALLVAAAILCFSLCGCGSGLVSIEVECGTTEYVAGEAFDTSTVSVNAVYGDGSKKSVGGWTCDAPSELTVGKHTVTVTYVEGDKTVYASFEITVEYAAHEHAFDTSEWKSDGAVHYHECECGARTDEAAHVRSGIKVLEEADCTTDGKQTYVCSVCDRSAEEKIDALGHNYKTSLNDEREHWSVCARCNEVSEKLPHGFSLIVENVKTDYIEGDTFTLDGATATVECDCGYVKNIDVAEITPSEHELELADDGATVTLTYGELKHTVEIAVAARALVSIRASGKTAYGIGENFGGGTLTLVYNNGATEEKALTVDMVKGFNTDAIGEVALTVEYGGKSCALNIKVGYDEAADAYVLGVGSGYYKVQAEDERYVDMSGAKLQTSATDKFQNTTTTASGATVPNGAEGSSTCNISMPGNKIVIKFYSETAGKFRLGIRAQSGNNSGKDNLNIADAFTVKVNNAQKTISGVIEKSSTSNTNWKDMTHWTTLEDMAGEIDAVAGLNTIEFAYRGTVEGGTMRLPNIDYFIITKYAGALSLEAEGEVSVSYGGAYDGGLTLKVKDGDGTVIKTVPVTADMITGLDSMTEGECEITIAYLGMTATHTVTVEKKLLTLSVVGGTFAGGASSVQLRYGDAIPEISWSAQNIIGYKFDGRLYTDIAGLTMCADSAEIAAVTVADAKSIKLSTTIRFNKGKKDDLGNNLGADGDTTATTQDVDVLGTGDGRRFAVTGVKETSRGITFKANINFGSGDVLVLVKVINNGGSDIAGFAYGTECGTVSVGNVSAGQSASATTVIASDGNNHWTNIFWDGQMSEIDFTIAVYTYAI